MNHKKWLDKCQHWKQKWPTYDIKQNIDNENEKINCYTFIETLNEEMTNNETIVYDAGIPYYIISHNLKTKQNQKIILSGAQADMGFSLPASIGVYLADTTKNVVVITGDGSFNTNIQELATIRNLNIPLKIFVLNNNGYLSIRNTQKKFYENRVYGTSVNNGLWFPDLNKIANAYEIEYFKIKNNKELYNNIKNVLNKKNTIICEIICKEDQEVIPTLMLKKDENGNTIQCGLDDMYPFLSQKEIEEEKII
jgi:acetolactate synthase-1/2/3 large subunit